MRTLLLALTLALVGVTTTADAQVREDLVEAGGSGSLVLTDGTFLSLSPVLGYFITDRVEVGLNPSVSTNFDDGSVFLTAFGALHFPSTPQATTVPFVGAQTGLSLTEGGGLALGAQGGVKQFVAPGGAITLTLNALTDDSFDEVTVFVAAGVSIFFERN